MRLRVGALLLLVGITAAAAGSPASDEPARPEMKTAIERVFELTPDELRVLGLGPSVLDAMSNRAERFYIEARVIADERRAADQQMRRLLNRFPADREDVMKQAEKVAALRLLADKKRLETILDLREHLTKHQFRQIKQIRKDRRERRWRAEAKRAGAEAEASDGSEEVERAKGANEAGPGGAAGGAAGSAAGSAERGE